VSAITDELGRTQSDAVDFRQKARAPDGGTAHRAGAEEGIRVSHEAELKRYASELAAAKIKVSLLKTSLLKFRGSEPMPFVLPAQLQKARLQQRDFDFRRRQLRSITFQLASVRTRIPSSAPARCAVPPSGARAFWRNPPHRTAFVQLIGDRTHARFGEMRFCGLSQPAAGKQLPPRRLTGFDVSHCDHSSSMDVNTHGLLIDADAGPGVLHRLTGVIAEHGGDIGTCSIIENTPLGARVYFEVKTAAWERMLTDLRELPIVRRADS